MLYGEPIGLDDQSEKKTGKLFRSFPRFPPVDLGHGEALVERRERKCTIYAQGMHAWKTGPRIFGHKIALSPRCGKRLNVSRVWRVASPQRAVSTCQGPTAKDREKKVGKARLAQLARATVFANVTTVFLVGLFCWSASSREQAPERYCPNTSVVDPVVREKFRLRRLCFLGSNDSRLCTMAQGAVKKSKAAAPKKYVRCRTISTVLGALLMSNS